MQYLHVSTTNIFRRMVFQTRFLIHHWCFFTFRPYKDPLLISSQVLAILGLGLAWSSVFGGLLFAFVGCILIWTSCCCRMSRCGILTAGVFLTLAAIACMAQGIFFFGDFCQVALYRRRRLEDYWSGWESSAWNSYEVDQSYTGGYYNGENTCNLIAGFGVGASVVMLVAAILAFVFSGRRLKKQRATEGDDEGNVPLAVLNTQNVVSKGEKAVEDREEEEISSC